MTVCLSKHVCIEQRYLTCVSIGLILPYRKGMTLTIPPERERTYALGKLNSVILKVRQIMFLINPSVQLKYDDIRKILHILGKKLR